MNKYYLKMQEDGGMFGQPKESYCNRLFREISDISLELGKEIKMGEPMESALSKIRDLLLELEERRAQEEV
jgi:hypothetical protein